MQEVVNPGQAVEHAELPFQPTPKVLAATNAIMRVSGNAIEVLANPFFLIDSQVAMIAAAASVLQAHQTAGVVTLHPFLQRAPTDAGCLDDLRRGMPMPGQNHNLKTPNHRGPLLPLGQTHQLHHRMMFANMHARLLARRTAACHNRAPGAIPNKRRTRAR